MSWFNRPKKSRSPTGVGIVRGSPVPPVPMAAQSSNNPDSWPVYFLDDSTKPISYRIGSGTHVHNELELRAGKGNYTPKYWYDGYWTDSQSLGSRANGQTYNPNPTGPVTLALGYNSVHRAGGRTIITARWRENTVLASTPGHAPAWRTPTPKELLSGVLTTQHSLKMIPPFQVEWLQVQLPLYTILEAWPALWVYQADSYQSLTDPTARVDVVPGTHVEVDLYEVVTTGGHPNDVFMNMLHQDVVSGGPLIGSPAAGYVSLGEPTSDHMHDVKGIFWTDRVEIYIDGVLKKTLPYPSTGRFATAPVYFIMNLEAGNAWSANAWPKDVDASTPTPFILSWSTFRVRKPDTNTACFKDTVDPPTCAITWVVNKNSIDNSAANGTLLANLSVVAGVTYEVHGRGGIGVSGNTLVKTGSIAPGPGIVTVLAVKGPTEKYWLPTEDITVADNSVWWDATARVHVNLESQQVRLLGVAGTYATYVDVDGNPTATFKALIEGASGTLVVKGAGGAAAFAGLYGTDATADASRYTLYFLGNTLSMGGKTTDLVDRTAVIANMDSADDAFGAGISWGANGINLCGNGGTETSNAAMRALGTSGSLAFFFKDGFDSNPFPGAKQQVVFYNNADLGFGTNKATGAVFRGKCVPA